mmetsp:Transcript_10056/g.25165  ORF Transcript_10056/g.25165 Transcript_10056/m.25165 type:complete len:734 (-) Transcript_10056:75-2276(-)
MARIGGVTLFGAMALALLAAATAEQASGGGRSIAGVQKVIQMLTDMTAKGKQEKNDEEVAFAKFKTWCSHETASLKGDIKKGGEQIETLAAHIGKLGTDIKGLGEDIADLQNKKASDEADLKAHKEQRAKDHEDFLATEADFSESVDALERAIGILSEENYDRPAAASALLQLSSSTAARMMPQKAHSIMQAFIGLLQQGKSPLGGMDYEAPEANAYEFQSSSIIDMLKKLQDEFREKLGTAQKEEKNSQHAHDMIVMDLTDAIENAAKMVEEKTKEKERKASEKAADEKQLEATKATKASDEQTLKEVTTECEEKTLSFKEKQQLRTEELEAIAKAIEILKSPDALGNAEKHLDLAQVSSASSLLQGGESVRAMGERRSQGVHRRVREFLESEGRRLKSKHIALLADKILADPFAKVKQMIDSMITRLLEEANEDADHEGFCDTEMGKSKITRNKLNEDIEALTAATDNGKARILALTDDTEQLSKEVKDLVTAMGEATQLRKEEKAKNKETVADAKAAQTAVAAATAVLKDFYEKAGTATGFLQLGSATGRAPSPRKWGLKTGVKMGSDEWNALANPNMEGTVDTGHKEGMQTFGEAELGQQDEANGVLGLLEVIMADFATLEADTTAAEAASQEAYERFMVESKKNKATKDRKIDMNNSDRAEAEAKLQEDTADLKTTQDELLAAERYYKKLVPQCVDQGMTWDERVAARQAEIDSLKEALKLLNSPDVA